LNNLPYTSLKQVENVSSHCAIASNFYFFSALETEPTLTSTKTPEGNTGRSPPISDAGFKADVLSFAQCKTRQINL
jgi:hypothetical protein